LSAMIAKRFMFDPHDIMLHRRNVIQNLSHELSGMCVT
jgi:hypothetical protein